MAKLCTLKQNKEFRRAYYQGKAQVNAVLITYVHKNRVGQTRIGITTGKKVGNAVKRSRCRRIIREAFYQNLPHLKPGYDYVFVARTATALQKSTDIQHVMKKQLEKTGHYV